MLAPTGTRRVLIASIIVLGILFFGTNIFVTRGTNADLVSFTPDQVKLMTSKMTTQEATIARLATEVDELRALKHDFEALQMNQAKQQPCVQTTAQPALLNPPSKDWGPDPFGWNRPPLYQWRMRPQPKGTKTAKNRNLKSKPEKGPLQEAFDALREKRHAIIGPIIRGMASKNSNTVIILLVNSGQMDLFLNFICSCEKRNLSWKDFVFVFALDAAAKVFLDSHGVAAYHLDDTDVANAAEKFSDHTFKKVIFWKSAVTYDVLLLEVNVIFQDVDIVWKSSPVSYFQDPKMQSVDVFFMKDGNNNAQQPLYANSGFHFNRYNERTLLLWEEAYLMGHTSNAQQTILSPLLIHHYFVNGLRVYLLPPRFTNGNYWMGKNKIDRVPSDWVVLHASWTTNMEAKIEKFGWMNEWYATCVAGKNAK